MALERFCEQETSKQRHIVYICVTVRMLPAARHRNVGQRELPSHTIWACEFGGGRDSPHDSQMLSMGVALLLLSL